MATRPFTTDDDSVDGFLSADRSKAASRINRYQLHVVASHTAEAVQSAGGWLCDRARAGWDVNVLVADHHDARPFMILGATALDLDAEFASIMRKASRGGALAISAGLVGANARVRDEVLRLLKRSLTEVIVWGDEWPTELGRKVDRGQRQLSCAARAFKAHALGAAAVSNEPTASTETLYPIGTGTAFRPLYSV
jgi:hypothetical protein